MDKESHCNLVMLDHERKLKVELKRLLRQIEEGLAHSREIIAHIDKVRRNRSTRLTQEAEGAGGWLNKQIR
jgi:hypothetical protein